MARFLFAVWPLHSHFHGLVPIAHALSRNGHEVAFYTGFKSCATLSTEGLHCIPFVRIDEDWIDDLFYRRQTFASWRDALRTKRLFKDWLLGTIPAQIEDLTEVIESWRPDVIVSETSMLGPMIVLHDKLKLPIAVYSTVIACLLPGPDIPPYGLGLPRRRWWSRPVIWMAERMRPLVVADFQRTANAIRGQYGLAPLDTTVTEYTGRMPLYLIPGVREFDYQRLDLPASVHYVGPCRWDQSRDSVPPEWLQELSEGTPLVHVTEGTMHAQKPLLLQAAAKGLADLPLQVIMTSGSHRDPAAIGLSDLAPNIRVESWVAHSDLLPRTDVVVTTGGAGTVSAILAAGIPLVIVPTEWDKPENARRVEEAGAGLCLSPSRCTPKRLRAAVEQVLGNPSFGDNAHRLAETWARYNDGPARAAGLLEQLARSHAKQRERTLCA